MSEFVSGDRVIWRRDGDEWTVDQVHEDHPRPIWLMHRMFGGEGPKEFAHAIASELVHAGRQP